MSRELGGDVDLGIRHREIAWGATKAESDEALRGERRPSRCTRPATKQVPDCGYGLSLICPGAPANVRVAGPRLRIQGER